MLEISERLNYEEWDKPDFIIPEEFAINDNSFLHEALEVFFAAGGYDFFKVIRPEKYADNWLDFIGGLYADIESGKYRSDGKQHNHPLSEEESASLAKQGVPAVFTKDII